MKESLHIAMMIWKFPDPTSSFTYTRAQKLAQNGCRVDLFYKEPVFPYDIEIPLIKNMLAAGVKPYCMPSPKGALLKALDLLYQVFRNGNRITFSTDFMKRSMGEGYSLRESIRLLWSIYPVLFSNPDIIHIESSFLALGKWKALKIVNKPVVISLRGTDIVERPNVSPDWKKFYFDVGKEPAFYFHCVSRFIKNTAVAVGLPSSKLRIIYLGIGVKRNLGLPRIELVNQLQDFDLILVSRFSYEKGVDLAIRAVQILHSHGFTNKLFLIGYGPDEENLKKLSLDLGLQDSIIILGKKSNDWVLSLLYEMNEKCIYLQPSRSDALPQSILEAQSAGLPVIAANVGGIPEIITHGENGLLHQPESPEDIAEKVEQLMGDRAYSRKLARSGAETVAHKFSDEQEISQFLEYYLSLVNQHE